MNSLNKRGENISEISEEEAKMIPITVENGKILINDGEYEIHIPEVTSVKTGKYSARQSEMRHFARSASRFSGDPRLDAYIQGDKSAMPLIGEAPVSYIKLCIATLSFV